MSESSSKSWDEVVDKLQRAANDLRSTAGRAAPTSAEEDAAAARLKADVSRLEQSAAELRSKLTQGLNVQRTEFETTVDRERAEQAASQVKAALDELAGLARAVTHDLKAAAETSFTQAQPELKTAIRTLEDVASSAGAWIRAVIDPKREPHGREPSGARPPLDDL